MGRMRKLRIMLSVGAVLVLLTAMGPRAEAGVVAPCERPIIFPGSDVNLVLLPYALNSPELRLRQDSFALWDNDGARALSSLIQFDTLYALRYPAALAVVQLFAEGGDDCSVERVKRDVEAMLAPGKGAVFLWGGLVERDGQIFVQSYVEFFRKDRPDLIAFDMPSPAGTARYLGGVPQRGIGLPPRILTRENMTEIGEAATSARRLSAEPGGPPEIALPDAPDATFAFYVTAVRDDGWMRIRAATSERDFVEPDEAAFEGWLPAQPDWSLRRLLPDLDFVEAAIGFLVGQIVEEERMGDHWAGGWVRRYDLARTRSAEAVTRFVEATGGAESGAADIDAATSVALAETMRAAMALNGPPVERVEASVPGAPTPETMLDLALVDLGHATRLVPYHPESRNLLAIALSARAALSGDTEEAASAAAEWQRALSLAPNDRAISANLAAYYRAAKEAGLSELLGLSPAEIDTRLRFLASEG